MGLDNSRLFLAQDFILCHYVPWVTFSSSPAAHPLHCGPPAPPCGAVLALLPICYICTPIIELNTFSINNDHSYQLGNFDNDYQLISVFQRAFLITYFSKATGAILRHPTC